MAGDYVLAIDQGTTASRALVLQPRQRRSRTAQREFTQHYPRPGWVEHDANEIWEVSSAVMRDGAGGRRGLACRHSGDQHYQPARDRRHVGQGDRGAGPQRHRLAGSAGAQFCDELTEQGYENTVANKTGLVIDAYFSGSKVSWMLLRTWMASRSGRRTARSPSAP